MRDVNDDVTSPPDASAEAPSRELRGSVLDVVRALLAENDSEAVLEIVSKLVAENADMSRRLAQVRARFKTSEKIGRAQLVLFVDALHRGEGEPASDAAEADGPDELDDADATLRAASGIDDHKDDGDLGKLTTRPPRQPANRTAAPAHLRRVDNPLMVRDDRRACPRCGTDRTCVGHDVTEVLELIPAEVIVRRDVREKLACATCEAELVRAPTGDKVVASGKIGLGLAASLLVEKYVDGLPLHRQRERLARLGLDIAVSTLADQIKWSTARWPRGPLRTERRGGTRPDRRIHPRRRAARHRLAGDLRIRARPASATGRPVCSRHPDRADRLGAGIGSRALARRRLRRAPDQAREPR